MGMSYKKIEVSRDLARDQLLRYLRANLQRLLLPEPVRTPLGTARQWFERTKKAGRPVNDLASDVFEQLTSLGIATVTDVPVYDSGEMSAYDAYYALRIKMVIVEEIVELVRMGVLAPVGFTPEQERLNFNFVFDVSGRSVIVTEYGVRYLAEASAIPYFADDYLEQLRQIAEPHEELVGYLSEGLACLRNHLARAGAMLLRLAAEHSLNRLIESTEASLGSDKQRQTFTRRIRKAGIRIEKRAEVVFRQLESSSTLIPDTKHSRNEVKNRLRPAFHSIRDLGGRAAHTASKITLEEVRAHYTLYTHSVYGIVVRIIDHQGTLGGSS